MLTCADCQKKACKTDSIEGAPQNCPMRTHAALYASMPEAYHAPQTAAFYQNSCKMESQGYCQWSRVRETLEFCKAMGYAHVGVAFCTGLHEEARIFCRLLREHGLTVSSICCKNGGIAKEAMGLTDADKVRPGRHESACNPIAQAALLNEAHTQFNILIGLCVGHDSLFMQHAEAPCTVLVVKDRVLAHNPCGALYQRNSYYKNAFGTPPQRPL